MYGDSLVDVNPNSNKSFIRANTLDRSQLANRNNRNKRNEINDITDMNDLDDPLFGIFGISRENLSLAHSSE